MSSALALSAAVALLGPPAPARAETPAPDDQAAVTQTLPDFRQSGCRKPSTRAAQGTPWAQVYLRPEAVWPFGRGAGVTVAVIASGVDNGSGMLADRLRLGPRLHGQGDAGRDCVGHGTFLAGLIAGRRTPDGGPSGLAPEARVLAVAVTDDAGSTTPELLAQGIRAAADGGARVAVVGVPVAAPNPALAEAVAYAATKGLLLVAPAGPDGQSTNGAVYPAGYPGVLAVTGVGADGAVASGAATGPGVTATRGGRVDLAAPGGAVGGFGLGGGYATGSGPSYAAALVAGAAALLLFRTPDLTVDQLVQRLESTAYQPGSALPDPALGWGTLDVVAAVTALPGGGGGQSPVSADPVTVPPPADPTSVERASALAAAALGTAVLVGLGAVAVGLGRRRGRCPG
ncbi:S8 family serine peptidase [Kitasatospora sp. NPDC092286]|uniref:S8 family serine peptidase n=1 Tax=Kitasatospora sp. NPDC092286 TaxID=3364087 RepID=UPI0038257F7E